MTDPDEKARPSIRDVLRQRTVSTETSEKVPPGLRLATAYAWRFLVIAAAIGVAVWLIIQFKLLVVPVLVSLLLSALLWPGFSWLLRHRVPRWLAIIVSIVSMLIVVSALLWLAVWQITRQWSSVQERTLEAVDQLRSYLIDGPLHLTEADIDGFLAQLWGFVEQQASLLWSGALAIGTTVGHVVAGALLALFILICMLADGAGIWRWTMRLFPRAARETADGAGRAGWASVINYARTQLLVATIDAIGIGLGAFFLGVPLAIPIGILVFLGAFVPFIGAIVTGAVAVFLALVYNGPWIAFWMLVVVLAVQQIESHVLQPILMGSAVKVHPLTVVLVVAGGTMIAGIPGALFAVPLAAFVNVVALYVSRQHAPPGASPPPPDELIWTTVPRTKGRRG